MGRVRGGPRAKRGAEDHEDDEFAHLPQGIRPEELGELEQYEEYDEGEEGGMDDGSDDEQQNAAAMEEATSGENGAYLPGKHGPPRAGEQLVHDNSAYDMMHKLNMEWPCLSFDFMRDPSGVRNSTFPMSAYAVAGTQADIASRNKLMVMRMSSLHKTKHDDDSDADSEDEAGADDEAVLSSRFSPLKAAVNRVRCMPQESSNVAVWLENGQMEIHNVSKLVTSLSGSSAGGGNPKAEKLFGSGKQHRTEGYGLDWSRTVPGRLLSADCNGTLVAWSYQNGTWKANGSPYKGHKGSIEDLQWSPNEPEVFASCGVDGTVRLWDARKTNGSALHITASKTDINVIAWNSCANHMVASGADDGGLRVWDLRNFKSSAPVASLDWHKEAITSLEWHPFESSILAVSSADDQLSIWDLSLERDEEEEAAMREAGQAIPDVPPQLVFVHQGQRDFKELHFHPFSTGVIGSTSLDGLCLFKAENID